MKLKQNNDTYIWLWIFTDIIFYIGYFLLLTWMILQLSGFYKVPHISTMSFPSLMFCLIIIKGFMGSRPIKYKEIEQFIDADTNFRNIFFANALKHLVNYLSILYFWAIGVILYLLINL